MRKSHRSGSLALCATVATVMFAVAGPAQASSHTSRAYAGLWPKSQVQTLKLAFGPFTIAPGQNNIKFDVVNQRPTVDGWVVSFVPNLVYTAADGGCDGAVPAVDVVHLHHGVWLMNGQQEFGAGEEKTRVYLPKGYGKPYKTTDSWVISYMIHNLTPQTKSACLTYDMGFIAADSPFAKGIIPVRSQPLGVQGGVYPVFDVHQGSGTDGQYTYPTQADHPYGNGPAINQWTVTKDQTIIGTGGHLHPGGLYTSLYDTRMIDGAPKTVLVFRSRAHYFEPAGTVSWDVAMMTSPPGWRVAVKKGDVMSVTATYNSKIGSWYEAMGIMPMTMTNDARGGVDPFTHNTAVAGWLNHGHLPENDNHGGGKAILPDARKLADGALISQLPIDNFVYGHGDLTLQGTRGLPPTIRQGQSLTFTNHDAGIGPGEWHTITSCRAPCNQATGIAYPLASVAAGQPSFDSGELGLGGPPTAGRTTWSTPNDLGPGTYTYFCRIHPFMRGAFRVLPAQ